VSRIKDLIFAGDFKAAMDAIDEAFSENPTDEEALYYFGMMMLESDHPGPARVVMEHLLKANPKKVAALLGLARAWDDLEVSERAKPYLMRAHKIEPQNPKPMLGLSSVATKRHRWDEAIKWADRMLAIEPGSLQAEINKAFALLNHERFEEGWALYAKGVGHMKWRDERQYLDLPHWSGEEGARVIWYGEQGIGDQIAFLSALPGAPVETAAINCHPKLAPLFRDTFESIPVFGDQFVDSPEWAGAVSATHMAPMSWLHAHFRKRREDYKGDPYLLASYEKTIQWRALLSTLPRRPNIGIAWTGGAKGSFKWKEKSLPLEAFLPLFEGIDANWIDLEYKDRIGEIREMYERHGHRIVSWSWGTQTNDYSDTAGLVANLDAVVCVPTAVYHLAGGLNVPAFVLVQKMAHFHESGDGEWCKYYRSVRFLRRDAMGLDAAFRRVIDEMEGRRNGSTSDHAGRAGTRGIAVPGDAVGAHRVQDGSGAVHQYQVSGH